MDTQFKCCTLNSLESKLREAYKQSRWTLDSSGFLQQDLDMWDTKSHLMAQTSAWCGMASVSGTGFLSKVSSSTSGSTVGFRQNDPGLRRWQSLSHVAPESATQSLSPSLGAELRATRSESRFRQLEVEQWLQDAHERLDTQLERLRTRDTQLSYHITAAQQLDMKYKQLSEAMRTLELEEEATNLSKFGKSQKCRELRDKSQKDLLQMRSTLDRGRNDQPPERTPGSLSRTLPVSQEDFNRHEKQKVDTEQCKLKKAEITTKAQEDEQNQTQRMLLNQIEELNQRLSHSAQNHSEVQEQLTEANNKISQACLEKAILSMQVLKLEDNIKDLKAKLTEALSDKRDTIQDKADLQSVQVLELEAERTKSDDIAESHNNKQGKETVLMKEESKVLREVNEKLTCQLELIKQRLEVVQCQLQELTAERINVSKQVTDLEAENSQLIREREELLNKMYEGENEMKDKCCQLRESVEILQLEKQKLQDQYVCLEAKLLEEEEEIQLQEEEYKKKDAVRVQNIEELKAVASHWAEKWQKVALALQSTQEELDNVKKNSRSEPQHNDGHLANELKELQKKIEKDKEQIDNLLQQKVSLEKLLTDNKKKCDSLLRIELDACKQELDLERSRNQMLLQRYKGGEDVQTQDKETLTDLSESSLLLEPPSDSHSSQNNCPPWSIEKSEVELLKRKLAEREKELREKTEALKSLERIRDTGETEAQIKFSALELKEKASEDSQDSEDQANASTTDSLRAQLEESSRRANQLQQEKTWAVQRLQTLKDLYPIKDEEQSVEGRDGKTVCSVHLETDQQRRMITEQLKNLFKEREEKEAGEVDGTAAAARTGAPSLQDWTSTPKVVRTVDRWNWQQSSGLMPVFEEDEEDSELPTEEEEQPREEGHVQKSLHNETHQISAMNEANIKLKAKNENLLQVLRVKQTSQDQHITAEKVSQPSDAVLPNLCSDDSDRQRKTYSLYPDGIFLAERVDLCSSNEDEEEELSVS
ncbi:mitotic spindle assembly checkpoint protein MAD1-like [Anabas testudineus]|uniref:mitotic spindle assembly checkpoint protein MAD1-like n=1 Tax=Anabas testudineus TaxID=64144 RepID=UPI000E4598B7|nr:mitotic spindle assembly checkpoint protein MAD1-like [Anabas testudineus]